MLTHPLVPLTDTKGFAYFRGAEADEVARAPRLHRPERNRERVLRRFKSPGHAPQLLEAYSAVCSHFRPGRHLLPATQDRQIRTERFRRWRAAARLHGAA